MDKTLYVISNGVTLRRVGKRLRIEKANQRLCEIPLKDVARVLIYSRAEVTSQTLTCLMKLNIPLYYLKRSGALIGKIACAYDNQITLRSLQHRCFSDSCFALSLAKAIVAGKINNMLLVVIHMLRKQKGTADLCNPLRKAFRDLQNCRTREEIMGTEGAAAAHYFKIYGSGLPEPFRFRTRSRRPAIDATNAMLNLGYMTVLREIQTHIEAHHLDSYLGVLHCTQDGRPSLALDLLEEFRQALVDLFILSLVKRGQITPNDFIPSQDGGIQMSDEGFHKFFRLYEQRMGNQDGENPGLRQIINLQVAQLKKHIRGEDSYIPFNLTLEENQ